MMGNNCGPRKGWFDVPDFCFSASCEKHDEYYIKGGKEVDRYVADYMFYWYMKQDIKRLDWYKRPLAHIVAKAYFYGVRLGGAKHFNYN